MLGEDDGAKGECGSSLSGGQRRRIAIDAEYRRTNLTDFSQAEQKAGSLQEEAQQHRKQGSLRER